MIFGALETEEQPEYREDAQIINGFKFPSNATPWCIRVVFDKIKLYLNRVSIAEIKERLSQDFSVSILHFNENERSRLVMRIYLKNDNIFNNKQELVQIVNNIIDADIRGVPELVDTKVFKDDFSVMDETGKISTVVKYVIHAEGANIRGIYNRLQTLYSSDIDFDQITCNNPQIIMQFFGKMASKRKLTNEINLAFRGTPDRRHVAFIANVMTHIGTITSIESNGLKQRNPNVDLLSVAQNRHVTNLVNSAFKNKPNVLQTLSDNLIMG